jgi:hypothetical protein
MHSSRQKKEEKLDRLKSMNQSRLGPYFFGLVFHPGILARPDVARGPTGWPVLTTLIPILLLLFSVSSSELSLSDSSKSTIDWFVNDDSTSKFKSGK